MENDYVIKVNDNYGFGFLVGPDGHHNGVVLTNIEGMANTWGTSLGRFGYKYFIKLPTLSNRKKYEVFTSEDSIKVTMEEVRLGIKKWEKKTDLRPSQVKYLEFLKSIV